MKKAFVIGHPIKHSRSPLIHGTWLEGYHIAGSYEAIDVPPAELPVFIERLRRGEFAGGNVTIPHKEAVFALCDSVDPLATTIAAVNTLVAGDGQVHGFNTDFMGFLGNLDQNAAGWEQGLGRAVVLGAGGAARAILVALRERGVPEIIVLNRTPQKAEALAKEIGGPFVPGALSEFARYAPDAGLLVNTTSIGMHDTRFEDIELGALPRTALVTDIVYVPLVTPLLAEAAHLGLRTVDGLGMLLHQAVPGFEAWFGVRPEVTPELRARIEADALMLTLGLTGSIATGKSTVLKAFADLGVPTFSSDDAVHELYRGAAVAAVETAFPGVTVNGAVDRQRLSADLLEHPERLQQLEAIVHPLVRAAIRQFLDSAEAHGAALAVVDIPLLFENGVDWGFDAVIVTAVDEAELRRRALGRPGMTVEKLDAILARQMPQAEKVRRADYVIDTSATIEATRHKVATLVARLLAEPKATQ